MSDCSPRIDPLHDGNRIAMAKHIRHPVLMDPSQQKSLKSVIVTLPKRRSATEQSLCPFGRLLFIIISIIILLMRQLLLIVLALLSASTAFSQSILRGTIQDSLGDPVPGATIMIKGTYIYAIADAGGHFK